MFWDHGNVFVCNCSKFLIVTNYWKMSTETFGCRNGWIEGFCGRWIHIGQIDFKPLCKYMYIEFNIENSTVLCEWQKWEIWVQVRRGPQRGHSIHRCSQSAAVGRSRSPLRHPRVQCQSQRLCEYQKLFIWEPNNWSLFSERWKSKSATSICENFRSCINLDILKEIGINYAPTWPPLARLLTFPSVLTNTLIDRNHHHTFLVNLSK